MSRLLKSQPYGKRLSYDFVRPHRPILTDPRGAGAIHTCSEWSLGQGHMTAPGGAAWPSANAAIFVPFRVPVPVTITHLAMGTGTGSGGNYDQGIYDEAGNLIISTGSTARPGASQESIVDVTDTVLMPGLYYQAMSVDGTTNIVRTPVISATAMPLMGTRQMASAFPLPSTATLASQTLAYLPHLAAYLKMEPFRVWHGQVRMPPLNVISTLHGDSVGHAFKDAGLTVADLASSGTLGANVVYYHPFVLHEAALAQSMSYVVGATSNGNVDVGIYDGNGTLLVNSGSTAQGTANTLQNLNTTDTALGPGQYYMAMSLSSGTGTALRTGATDEATLSTFPALVETTGSFGLPSTMTPASSTAAAPLIPYLGVHFNSLV